jgi:hypothetical protein
MSLAALLAAGIDAAEMRLGEGDSEPSPSDVAVTNPVAATVTGVTLTDDDGVAVITIEWHMPSDIGNGLTFREQGLFVGGSLISRQLFAPVAKTAIVQLRGTFTLRLSLQEVNFVPGKQIMAHSGGETATIGTVLVTYWNLRAGDTIRVHGQWRWSGAFGGQARLEFRAANGSTVLHYVDVGDATYPGTATAREFDVTFAASLLTENLGQLWLRRMSGSVDAVRVANVLVESYDLDDE